MSIEDDAVAYNDVDFVVRTMRDQTRLGETLPARVGAPAPEFEAARLNGGTYRLADSRGKRHVVLVMGAITSPMTAVVLPGMNELHHDLIAENVDFYLVYVKESHPGEHYPHHTSMEQKIACARDLQREENPAFPILVDSLDGKIHRAYGQWPISLFVIHKDGRLVFRSTIAQPFQLRNYLTELLDADRLARDHPERVRHLAYTEYLVEHEADEAQHYRVYSRAGPKAFEDTWRANPARRHWPAPPKTIV